VRLSVCSKELAERVGFEPTLPVKVNTLSKRAPSATRPSLHFLHHLQQLQRGSLDYPRDFGARLRDRANLNFSHSAISPGKTQSAGEKSYNLGRREGALLFIVIVWFI
jgi:hypothetical protein